MAAQLALLALIHQLIASHQHSNKILGILRVGIVVGAGAGAGVGASASAGAGAGTSAGMLIEAVHKYQAEVAAPK